MPRVTKKELNLVLVPMFKAADLYALGLCANGREAPRHEPITWRGFKMDIQVVRRPRVVCGVPFPFALFEFWYEGKHDGKRVVAASTRPEFIDALFRYCARNGINLSESI